MKSDSEVRKIVNEEMQAYFVFMEENKKLFKNSVIQGFFENQSHVCLLAKYLRTPTPENLLHLEVAFRRFFFRIRFTKYLSSLIRFSDIDYHRNRIKNEQRNVLIFDSPNEEGEGTFGEMLQGMTVTIEDDITATDSQAFQQSLDSDSLFFAFNSLTDRQKFIITLAYSCCVLDTDIANLLQISQQAISKTRQSALRKMRQYLSSPNESVVMPVHREGAT
ncbi:hypothetical protein [Paenibacillus periandrae]|uniref:hypothetical protein n=1 Tax=Paenibacillus periandrae TaxID=1761741 RepID=UPI001F0A00EF|nr:hypothetical protein [Paenibacillus periandrae]